MVLFYQIVLSHSKTSRNVTGIFEFLSGFLQKMRTFNYGKYPNPFCLTTIDCQFGFCETSSYARLVLLAEIIRTFKIHYYEVSVNFQSKLFDISEFVVCLNSF